MKIKKSVSQSYIGMYLVVLFADVLTSMLAIKFSNTLLIVLFSITAVNFALLLTSNILMHKAPKVHPYFLISSFLSISAVAIVGLVFQILITIEGTKVGTASPYGWYIFPIAVAIIIPAMIFGYKFAFMKIADDNSEKRNIKKLVSVDSSTIPSVKD